MRYYIIHYPPDKFFTGLSPAPGDRSLLPPLRATWSSHNAMLLPASDVKETERDLRSMGEDGFTTSAVDL